MTKPTNMQAGVSSLGMNLRQRLLGWPDQHVDPKRTAALTEPGTAPKCLEFALSHVTGRPEETRILDIGCGRGDTVALLRSRGYDAYGIEVAAAYLENGRDYFQGDGDRLRLIEDGTYPFPDRYFDVVHSDQVLEHVEDLDAFINESARVLRPGGVGVHNFPARWRPVEPHMFTPFAHWLPKGEPRRKALSACLSLGLADPNFGHASSRDEQLQVMSDYSDQETFYRPLGQIADRFRAAGFDVDLRAGVKAKLQTIGLGDAPASLLVRPWRQFQAATLTVRKPTAPAVMARHPEWA